MNFKTSTSLIGAISQLLSKVMNVSLVSESFICWVVRGVKHPCGGRAWVGPLSGCGTASHWRGLRGICRVQLAQGPVFTSPCRSLRLSLAFLRPLLPSALPSSLCSAYYPSLSLFTCSLFCFIPADSFCLWNKNQSHLLRTARLQFRLRWFFLLVWNLNWICVFSIVFFFHSKFRICHLSETHDRLFTNIIPHPFPRSISSGLFFLTG